jgi:pimeloyl-ACP methyl ester carboxylesterase
MDAVLEPTLVRWFSADGLNSPGHPGVDYARRRLLHDDPLSFGSSWRALAEDRSSAALSSVSAPTTVLHASDDASVSLDASRRVAQLIPNARLETIPGPHLAPLESFTEFETAVLSHLDWVDRSRPSRAPSLSHRK